MSFLNERRPRSEFKSEEWTLDTSWAAFLVFRGSWNGVSPGTRAPGETVLWHSQPRVQPAFQGTRQPVKYCSNHYLPPMRKMMPA